MLRRDLRRVQTAISVASFTIPGSPVNPSDAAPLEFA